MLWEVDVHSRSTDGDHAARAVVAGAAELGIAGCTQARTAAGWLIEGDLSRADVERSPFYELLNVPLKGAVQTIGADAASTDDAELLQIPLGSPVLRCSRTTTDTSGRSVLLSEHVFPAHRTEFVVDLPQAEPSIAPSGLRLVE